MTSWLISFYCACRLCCPGGHGLTASGARPAEGWTIACPPELPLGTILEIEGFGKRMCQDRGSAIQGRHLDVFVLLHGQAVSSGVKRLKVSIVHTPERRKS